MSGTTRNPTWQVLWVFDPDGVDDSFAYTVGLTGLGLPELHLSARPHAGDDPDDPWRFSSRDCQTLLNDFAAQLVAGELKVGDEFTKGIDAGTTQLRFHLDPPVPRDTVSAYQAMVDAPVVPIRWTLHRPPEGAPASLPEGYAELLRPTVERMLKGLDLSRVPEQWRPPAKLSFAVEQPFGPLTAVVQATAATVADAPVEQLADFVNHTLAAKDGYSPARVLGAAVAQARAVGRTAALRSMLAAVPSLVDALAGADDNVAGGHVSAARWQEMLGLMFGPMSINDREDASDAVRNALVESTQSLLAAQLLSDVAAPELDAAGRGPWWWTMSEGGAAPGEVWHASPVTLGRVRSLLGPLDTFQLLSVAQAHLAARRDVDGQESRYAHVAGWLYAQMITSAVGMPPLPVLLAGTAAAEAVRSLTGDGVALAQLVAAAATLTAVVACTAKMHPNGRQVLVDVFANELPQLRGLLDQAAAE